MTNKKDLFSTLWVFVTLNYLYCDLIGLMDARLLKQYLTGEVEGFVISEPFLFWAGVLMEIPILMVLLSRTLPKTANAWTNIIAGSIKTVVMILTLCLGNTTMYYLFFAVIEIGTTLFIVLIAAKWLRQVASQELTFG